MSGSSTTTLPLPWAASGLSVAMVAKSLVNEVALTATVVDGDVDDVAVLLLLEHAAKSPMHTTNCGGHKARSLQRDVHGHSPSMVDLVDLLASGRRSR